MLVHEVVRIAAVAHTVLAGEAFTGLRRLPGDSVIEVWPVVEDMGNTPPVSRTRWLETASTVALGGTHAGILTPYCGARAWARLTPHLPSRG